MSLKDEEQYGHVRNALCLSLEPFTSGTIPLKIICAALLSITSSFCEVMGMTPKEYLEFAAEVYETRKRLVKP